MNRKTDFHATARNELVETGEYKQVGCGTWIVGLFTLVLIVGMVYWIATIA